MTVQALFERPAALPVMPKVLESLIASFQQDDVLVQTIASQLACDPVLCAKTLRLANSAYFHVSRRVETVDDAIRLLGFVMVRNLVMAAGLGQAFQGVKGLDLHQFWRHSLCTAASSRWLAGLTEVNSDLAFTTGLIQGLGHLVMRASDLATLQALDRECPPLAPQRAEAERRVLGFHHGQVAAELARRWNFPVVMSSTLASVPLPQVEGEEPLLGIVRIGVWHANRECLGLPATADADAEPLPQGPGQLALVWAGSPAVLGVSQGQQPFTPLPTGAELTAGLESLFQAG